MTKLERAIYSWAPIAFIVKKSKKLVLPGFKGLALYDVVHFFRQQLRKVGISERAAAISFNILMSIPASLIFLCTLIPYFPIAKQLKIALYTLIKDIAPSPKVSSLIIQFVKDFLETPRTGLLSFGFILVIIYSSNAVMGMKRSFDRSLHQLTKLRRKNFLHARWQAIKLTCTLLGLLMLTITIFVTQRAIENWLHINSSSGKFFIQMIRWICIIALTFYSIAFIYKYGPSIHNRWTLISPGSIFATFLMVCTTAIFGYWVNHFGNYNKLYGSIGTILILMILIFINSLVLLIGFELNVSINHFKKIEKTPS